MIYEKLNDIPLNVFNKILLGDKIAIVKDGQHSEEEIEYTCEMLISEYNAILGDKSSIQSCLMYEEALNNQRLLFIAKIGIELIDIDLDAAIEASRHFNYQGEESGLFDFLKSKEEYYRQRFEMSKIAIERHNKSKNGKKITEQDLAEERAFLMMDGIQIDQYKISAMEYACLLKAKKREIDAQRNILKKNKRHG